MCELCIYFKEVFGEDTGYDDQQLIINKHSGNYRSNITLNLI